MCGRRGHFGASVVAVALALACVLGGATAAAARAEAGSREYRLKAAFVYRFLQFTDWPAGAFAADDAPLVVALVGEDPFDGVLEQALAGKTVGRRAIQFKHVPVPPNANANANAGMGGGGGGGLDCHLLFVSPTLAPQDVDDVLRQVRGTPVLTVSDGGEFMREGGVLRLLVEENRVRFEVNLTAVQRQQLKMSAQVLKLARVYEERTP